MRCPKCNKELAPGNVYCPVCGQEVQIVPDYDPLDEMMWDGTETVKKQEKEEHIQQDYGKKRKRKTSLKSQITRLWKNQVSRRICLLLLGLVACIGAAGGSYYSIGRQNNYGYQLRQGIACYEKEKLEEAIPFLKRAQELQADMEGADERPLLYLGRIYQALEETDMAAEVYKEVLSFPLEEKEKMELYDELFKMLSDGNRAEKINDLIDGCGDDAMKRRLQPYRIEKPTVSILGGVYHYYVYPQLEAKYGTIYYTLDGSTPTEKSTPYKGRITLKEGENMLTAVAINDRGIVSEQLFVVYTLDFDVPVDMTNKNDNIDYSKIPPPMEAGEEPAAENGESQEE